MIARASGVGLLEQDGKLHVVDLGTRWAYTVGFVVGLLAFIIGAFGLAQIVLALIGSGGLLLLGAVFAAVAVVFGTVLWLIIKHVRSRNAAPLGALPVSVIFDLPAGQLCSAAGQPLAPLAEVRLRRKFQVTSSSRALELCWNGGSMVLVRGNPFAGGIDPIEDALRAKGIAVA